MGKRRARTIRAQASSRSRRSKRPRPAAKRRADAESQEEDTSTWTHDSSNNSRDWSDLSEGPTSLIASLILTGGDVADYIRFRTICRSWRRSSTDPHTLAVLDDSRLHPRQWIMLLDNDENLTVSAAPHRTRRRFLNVSTGECVHVDIPELRTHGVVRSSSTDGLLLLVAKEEDDGATVRLLNPLTRQYSDELPPITAGVVSPTNAGLVDDDDGRNRKVMLYGYRREQGIILAFAKPGDERWVVIKPTNDLLIPTNYLRFTSTTSFAGRFYGIISDSVMVVDTTATSDAKLVVAATLATLPIRPMLNDTAHLVEIAGELMLVHRRGTRRRVVRGDDYDDYETTCKLYRVNLVTGKVTPASARGRAIFVGERRALAVSPRVFPSLCGYTVYTGFYVGGSGRQIGAYNLRDGSTETFHYDGKSGLAQQHPWSVADCLAAYVSC